MGEGQTVRLPFFDTHSSFVNSIYTPYYSLPQKTNLNNEE